MFKISNFTNNNDVQIIQECGPFQVIEYQRDFHFRLLNINVI